MHVRGTDTRLPFLYVLFQIRLGEPLFPEVSLLNASNGTARFTCSALACSSEGSETWVLTNLNVHFLKSAFVDQCFVLRFSMWRCGKYWN